MYVCVCQSTMTPCESFNNNQFSIIYNSYTDLHIYIYIYIYIYICFPLFCFSLEHNIYNMIGYVDFMANKKIKNTCYSFIPN